MGSAPQVEIMFEKLVKPSSPTLDHLRVYKLSHLDLLNGCMYVPLVFFYPLIGGGVNVNPVESTTTERIEQLEKSLSEILSIYYPFAGRFSSNTDLDTVDCNDQGVSFLVKKVRTQIKDLIQKTENDFRIVDSLVPSFYVEEGQKVVDAPLVKVHISVFECGGLAICVSILKCLIDGFSHTKFVADWAKLMITGRSIGVHVVLNGGEIFPVLPQLENLSEEIDPPSPPRGKVKTKKIVARRIFLDGVTVASLKDHVMSSTGGWSFERPPSKVEVVTAVVWSGLIRAAQEKNGSQRPFMTSLSVNLRGKHVLSNLSENTIGNMYVPVPIKFIPGESRMELYDLVCLIRKTLQEKISECSKASKEDICSIYIKASNEMKEWSKKEDEFDTVFASSLCRFPLYDVDFGLGKPSRVSFATSNYSSFALLDTQYGDGVEVIMNLEEPDMECSIAHITNGMHVSKGY